MPDVFELGDQIGPVKVIYVNEPSCGLRAALVIDNVARGPSIGAANGD